MPSKARRLSLIRECAPATRPCCARRRQHGARQSRYLSGRINVVSPGGPLEAARRFPRPVDRSDKGKTKVDSAQGFWDPRRDRSPGFATKSETKSDHE